MPKSGDMFIVSLTESQLGWGTYRNTNNRASIDGEGYIAIPKNYASEFKIYNSNHTPKGLGFNEFNANSSDGFIRNEIILAQGCSAAGDQYAKNMSIKGDLKRIGAWFTASGATVNNRVKVSFISSTEVLLEII